MAASVAANRDQALGSIARGEHIGTAARVAAGHNGGEGTV